MAVGRPWHFKTKYRTADGGEYEDDCYGRELGDRRTGRLAGRQWCCRQDEVKARRPERTDTEVDVCGRANDRQARPRCATVACRDDDRRLFRGSVLCRSCRRSSRFLMR